AAQLNDQDAEGHYRLGKLYRLQQATDKAIRELRKAIQLNDRLYGVYFDLADLLLSRGESDEADALYRRVIRGAPDEELIARSARRGPHQAIGKIRTTRARRWRASGRAR